MSAICKDVQSSCRSLVSRKCVPHFLCTSSFSFLNFSLFSQNFILFTCSYYHMQWTQEGFLFGTVRLWFFVCVWNILGWTDLRQIHTEDVFGPSLQWVWRSRSKVRDKKTAFSALSVACTWFMFSKTSLASSFIHVSHHVWHTAATRPVSCQKSRFLACVPCPVIILAGTPVVLFSSVTSCW